MVAVGDKVAVYQKPLTEEEFEGMAEVIEIHEGKEEYFSSQGFASCTVEFSNEQYPDEKERVNRLIRM